MKKIGNFEEIRLKEYRDSKPCVQMLLKQGFWLSSLCYLLNMIKVIQGERNRIALIQCCFFFCSVWNQSKLLHYSTFDARHTISSSKYHKMAYLYCEMDLLFISLFVPSSELLKESWKIIGQLPWSAIERGGEGRAHAKPLDFDNKSLCTRVE